MNNARKIAKNTGILFTSQIISYILVFFVTMYTARYLGADGFGIISIALALTGIFGIFTDLGIGTLAIRNIARDKFLKDKYVANIILIKIFLSILTFGLIIVTVTVFNYPEAVKYVIYLITLSTIINAFSSSFTMVLQAYEQMEVPAVNSILNSIIIFSGVLIAIYLDKDIFFFASLYIIGSLACLIFNFSVYTWKFPLPPIHIDLNFWKYIIKEAWPFTITGIFVNIYFRIDSVMLSIMVGTSAVGIYNSAYRILMVLLFIPAVFITALFPAISRHFKTAQNLLKLEYEKSLKYLSLISIFILINGIFFAEEVIYLIFGSGYSSAVLILQILMLVVPIIFLTSLFGNILSAINKQRFVSIVAVLNALFNVAINIILIPKYSYMGASVATVLTELLGFILMFSYINRRFFKISVKEYLIKPILSGFLFALIIYYLKLTLPWFFAAIIGLFVYLTILYLSKLINEEDKDLFKRILVGGSSE